MPDAAGQQVAVDDAVDLVGARRRLVDALRECGDGARRVGEPAVEGLQVVELELAGPGHFGHVVGIRIGDAQGIVQAAGVQVDEVAVDRAAPRQERQQTVEQPHIGARPDRQVQVGQLAGGGVARIDHHHLDLRPGLLHAHDALEQDRVAPRGVGADQHDQVGRFQVVVADRHQVFAEGALVPGHGRRHAQPRVGVDVGAADEALHQLVGEVVVLGQQLAGDVERDGVRAVFVDDAAKTLRDGIERRVPRYAAQRRGRRIRVGRALAHGRMQQAAVQADGLAQRRALDAQPAGIGRMCRIARDADAAIGARRGQHAAADAAVRARGAHGLGERVDGDRRHRHEGAYFIVVRRPRPRTARGRTAGAGASPRWAPAAGSARNTTARRPRRRTAPRRRCGRP